MSFEITMSIFQISRACSSETLSFNDIDTAQNGLVYGNIVRKHVIESEYITNLR